FLLAIAAAQTPAVQPPTADERRTIERALHELSDQIAALRAHAADPALVADVDVYRRAAEMILRFPEEFVRGATVADTIAALESGLARARALAHGTPSWPARKGHVVRAYMSSVDGTVQPYALTIPASYDESKPIRLDIWQHGTNRSLNEIAFIAQHENQPPIAPDQDY